MLRGHVRSAASEEVTDGWFFSYEGPSLVGF